MNIPKVIEWEKADISTTVGYVLLSAHSQKKLKAK